MKLDFRTIKSNYRYDLTEILIFFVLVLFFLPKTGLEGDILCWTGWSAYFISSPFYKVYSVGYVNYPPLFLYILKLFSSLCHTESAIKANVNWLKVVPFFFDLLPLAVLFRFLKDIRYLSKIKYLLLFNIGYFYNSLFWGQVDGIHCGLIAIACLFLYTRPLVSVILLVLAVNAKLQTISILPVFAIGLIPYIFSNKFNILRVGFVAGVTQALLICPFLIFGGLSQLAKMALGSVGYYPVVSLNAYNIWYLLTRQDPQTISNKLSFMGATYHVWGTIFFLIVAFFALLPLFILSVTNKVADFRNEKSVALLSLTAGLVILVFFYFNTEMHERYSHGAMILFFIYGVIMKRVELFLSTSLVYLLSLESVLKALSLDYSSFCFQPSFLAFCYLLIIAAAFVRLYRLAIELAIVEKIRTIRLTYRSIDGTC